MKDSKTIRNEHQTFVDAWKKIQEDNSNAPVKEGYKDVKKMLKTNKKDLFFPKKKLIISSKMGRSNQNMSTGTRLET